MEQLKWLNKDLMQKVLQDNEKDESIKVSNILVKPATAKGDNFMSDMLRVTVDFSRNKNGKEITESRSIIVKLSPEGTVHSEMITQLGIFEAEISMIAETLPKMSELLSKLNMTPLAPQCLGVQHETPVHVIMEDLGIGGYRIAEHEKGLDLDHCILMIRRLAVFHASSVALAEKDSNAVTKYKTGFVYKDHPIHLKKLINAGMKALGEEAANWPELPPGISEKLIKRSEVHFTKLCEVATMKENEFNVLTHGDYWMNNAMFRYNEEGKPIDMKFVDFQMSYYGSPALDILFFFATTPQDNIRAHKREFLLQEYHNVLSSTMASLNCSTEVPSFEKLQGMLRDYAVYETLASILILPNALLKNSDTVPAEDLMSDSKKYDHPGYRNKVYREVMTRVLPVYDSMGLLDS